MVDGQLAGLMLVGNYCYVLREPDAKSIAEFFVMRKYRRKGVGRIAATRSFDRFPGRWEVLQRGENAPSYVFWNSPTLPSPTGRRMDRGR